MPNAHRKKVRARSEFARRSTYPTEQGEILKFALNVGRHRPSINRGPTSFFLVALLPVFMTGCGGGGDTEQVSKQGESVNATRKALTASSTTVTPISPADPRWDAWGPCADSDFVAITGGLPSTAPLLGRKQGCAKLVSDPQPILVATMRNASGNGYELCKLSAGRTCNYETAGYVTLATNWDLVNLGTRSTVTLQTRVVNWEWNPSFTLGKPGLTLTLAPTIDCSTSGRAGVYGAACKFSPALASDFAVALANGSVGPKPQFYIDYSWSFDATAGGYDLVTFRPRSTGFDYKVVEADIPQGQTSLPHVNSFGSAGESWEPEVRCDRYLTGSKNSVGCVLSQAAAIFIMDTRNTGNLGNMSEAAIHVRDAQTQALIGMTGPAPGVYVPKPGTRAVAEDLYNFPYSPLFYSPSSQDDNRRVACGGSSTSLIVQRGYPGSASCPTSSTAGCSCDEYPFASTSQGAAMYPGTTSVRNINARQNSWGGTMFGTFLAKNRILPDYIESEPFYVYVK